MTLTHEQTPVSTSIDEQRESEYGFPPEFQAITDGLIAEWQEVSAFAGVNSWDLPRVQKSRLMDFKTRLVSATDTMLGSTRVFRDAKTGTEVDTELTTSVFMFLGDIVDKIKTVCPVSTQEWIVEEGIEEVVYKSFTETLRNGMAGSLVQNRVYPGLLESCLAHASFAGMVSKYGPKRILAISDREHYSDLFSDQVFDELISIPSWRSVLMAYDTKRNCTNALTEERRLTDTEKKRPLSILREYGFSEIEAADVYNAWLSYRKNESDEEDVTNVVNWVRENVSKMDELSDIDPGLPRQAYKIFGIRNFGRYSAQAIAEQCNPGYKPDCIAVSGADDWNGAFNKWGDEICNISNRPLFIEASTRVDLIRRFITLRNGEVPRSVILIGTHGSSETLRFSRGERGVFTSKQIEEIPETQRLLEKGLINPDTHIILVSCNTGKTNGIGESIAAIPGVESVKAPDFLSRGIFKDKESGEIVFGHVREDLTKVELPGVTHTSNN